jgi:RND family efflux transporter MFP subunit
MKPTALRLNLLIPAVLLAGAIAWLTCVGCNSRPPGESANAPSNGAQGPVASSVASPTPAAQSGGREAKSFVTTGPLVAEQQADIAAERNGRVEQIGVGIGDHVKAGQPLALLHARLLRFAADAQKARIASAHAAVNEMEAEESSARAGLRRADEMRTYRIISEEEWERAKYRLDQAIAAVARYKSEQAAAEAESSTANLLLEQSRIVAPFDGVVGRSSVRLAQEVKVGDVLFWITAVAPLRVLFTVPESVMAAFPIGAALDLTTADYPGLHQTGRVVRVSPVVDPASGSVQVLGAVAQPSTLIKPGMSMQVRLAP